MAPAAGLPARVRDIHAEPPSGRPPTRPICERMLAFGGFGGFGDIVPRPDGRITPVRISLKHRLVAIANPRCGSTSLRAMLDPVATFRGPETCDLPAHAALRRVTAWLRARDHDPETFFYVTTVRNPWDRVVSIYHYGLKNPASFWAPPARRAGTFHRFVQEAEELDHYFRPPPGSRLVPEGPYVIDALMRDETGRMRGRAYRLEGIAALAAMLSTRLGREIAVPHVNTTPRGAYRGYYDAATRARVAHLLEADIVRFGYEF